MVAEETAAETEAVVGAHNNQPTDGSDSDKNSIRGGGSGDGGSHGSVRGDSGNGGNEGNSGGTDSGSGDGGA